VGWGVRDMMAKIFKGGTIYIIMRCSGDENDGDLELLIII